MVWTCSHPGVADNVLVQEEAALAQRLRARSAKEGAAAQHAMTILNRQHSSSKVLLVKVRMCTYHTKLAFGCLSPAQVASVSVQSDL